MFLSSVKVFKAANKNIEKNIQSLSIVQYYFTCERTEVYERDIFLFLIVINPVLFAFSTILKK